MMRAAQAGDLAARCEWFAETQAPLLAQLPLPALQKQQLIEQQFRAREQAYGDAYPGRRIDIVEWDCVAVGAAQVDCSADQLTLVDVVIAANCRGRGIGSAVLAQLQVEAMARGVPMLLSAERQGGAIHWYCRRGFEVVAAVDAFRDQLRWQPTVAQAA